MRSYLGAKVIVEAAKHIIEVADSLPECNASSSTWDIVQDI